MTKHIDPETGKTHQDRLWVKPKLPEFNADSPPYHEHTTASTREGREMLMKVTIETPNGVEQSVTMNKKVYSTGTKGFHGSGKLQEGDKKYQINFQMYEVGSKPTKKKG